MKILKVCQAFFAVNDGLDQSIALKMSNDDIDLYGDLYADSEEAAVEEAVVGQVVEEEDEVIGIINPPPPHSSHQHQVNYADINPQQHQSQNFGGGNNNNFKPSNFGGAGQPAQQFNANQQQQSQADEG